MLLEFKMFPHAICPECGEPGIGVGMLFTTGKRVFGVGEDLMVAFASMGLGYSEFYTN